MSLNSSILFKVLLNRFHPAANEALLKPLPEDETKEILTQTVSSDEAGAILSWPHDLIASTHYSWLAPLIREMPRSMQGAILVALGEPRASKLKVLLKVDEMPSQLSQPMQTWLLDQLYRRWKPQATLPVKYLPMSPLQALLSLSKRQLVELIDFLAMYDLSDAIRHIVDKKCLKNIYQCLSNKHQQFLRQCLQKKEKIASPSLHLNRWDGNPEKFHLILHQRGMLRLGKALCGQHPNFVWHLTHILDSGRGAVIMSHYREQPISHVTPLLVQQVNRLINFLRGSS